MTDWLSVSVILSLLAAIVILFILGACHAAGKADELTRWIEEEADLAVDYGDPCPWDLK